jgi:hypothetical protein
MIKLQFSTSTEFSSTLIRELCHSPFSHVDIVVDRANTGYDGLLGASDSPKAPYFTGNPHGVAIRPFDYQIFGRRSTAFLKASPEVEAKFYQLALSQLGKPFDNHALVAFLKPGTSDARDWRSDDLWFCSEFGAWCLEMAKWFPWEILVSKGKISPADLLLLVNWGMANISNFWDENAASVDHLTAD